MFDDKLCTQITLDEDLVISDHKPKIESILRITSTPQITKIIPKSEKLIFCGEVYICLEYVAQVSCDTQPIHYNSVRMPFSGFIPYDCHPHKKQYDMAVKLELQEFRLAGPRIIEQFTIVQVCLMNDERRKPAYYHSKRPIDRHSCRDADPFLYPNYKKQHNARDEYYDNDEYDDDLCSTEYKQKHPSKTITFCGNSSRHYLPDHDDYFYSSHPNPKKKKSYIF